MNCGNRVTSQISDGDVRKFVRGAEFAAFKRWPLNHFLTVHLERGGLPYGDHARFITEFDQLAHDYLARNNLKWVAVSVLEAKGGLHWHLLFHLPPELEKRFRYHRWLKMAGLPHSRKKKVTRPHEVPWPESANVVRYLMKGASTAACDALGIEQEDQGTVIGKRVRVSEAISQKARREDLRFPWHLPIITQSEFIWGPNWPAINAMPTYRRPPRDKSRSDGQGDDGASPL